MGKKLTHEFVRQYFEDNGCYLLEEEYVNSQTKMAYICECGSIAEISWSNFRKGSRCWLCGHLKSANALTFHYRGVAQYFKDNGCVLLDGEYINCKTKLTYICECGNIAESIYDTFKRGTRCYDCGIEKSASARSLRYKDIEKYFADCGCVLIDDEYIRTHAKMAYICECGNISEITYAHFSNGKRCYECWLYRMSGENSPTWKPELTQEERIGVRRHLHPWKKQVRKRDKHNCVICSNTENLHVHHLNCWSKYKKQRLTVSNGVTLCKECHFDFHLKYGRHDNTKKQFNEYLKTRIKLA
jgi:hypothetical protein